MLKRMALAVSLVAVLPGCSDPVTPEPTLTLTALPGTSDQHAPAGYPLPQSLAVRATADGHPAAGVTITWAASAGSLERSSTVTGDDGIASTGWTLGPAPGIQYATATAPDTPGPRSASFVANAYEVDPHELLGIAIDPPAEPLRPGDAVQLTVRTFTRDRLPYDAPVTWTSHDLSVARVSEAGVLTAVAAGNTRIAAYMEDAGTSVEVTVVDR
jgi:adhesin/invasin